MDTYADDLQELFTALESLPALAWFPGMSLTVTH
jgi:hypothetical protein